MPKVSVVIPAHNEAESIALVLADLPLRKLHQVIVVDNSTTETDIHTLEGQPALT